MRNLPTEIFEKRTRVEVFVPLPRGDIGQFRARIIAQWIFDEFVYTFGGATATQSSPPYLQGGYMDEGEIIRDSIIIVACDLPFSFPQDQELIRNHLTGLKSFLEEVFPLEKEIWITVTLIERFL